jgi:hypothetical protein
LALASANIKLKRANLHTNISKREMFRFLKSYEQPVFWIEPEGEPASKIGDHFSFWIVVKQSHYPDLPDTFAARFGDAIHNYRCVLDHVAWQLVKHGSCPNPKDPKAVQFPIHSTEGAFHDRKGFRLPGVASPQVDFICAAHKYKRGKATNETLLSLADLSNNDKHRTIKPLFGGLAGVHHQVVFAQCEPIEIAGPPAVPELKPDAKIAHVEAIVTGEEPNVHMGLTPAIYIVLDDGRPMLKVLYEIREQVTAILNAPEIVAGL